MAKPNKSQVTDATRKAVADALGEGWEPIESGKNLKFEEGERVQGRILKLPYPSGKSNAFDIEVASRDGTEVVTYWSPTILTNLFKKIKVGDEVAIQCVGKIYTPNGDAYDFALLRKKR